MNIGMRISSASTATVLAPQQSAPSVPAGDSFVALLNAASVIRFPVQPIVGSAPKQQSEQGSLNGPAEKQTQAQTASVQSNGTSRRNVIQSADDRTESVTPETTDKQDKSIRKIIRPESTQPSTSPVTAAPDTTAPMPQIAETKVLNADPSLGQRNLESIGETSSASQKGPVNVEEGRVSSDSVVPVHAQQASSSAVQEPSRTLRVLPRSENPEDAMDQDNSAAPVSLNELQGPAAGTSASTNEGSPLQPMPLPMLNTLADKQGGIAIHGDTTQQIASAKTSSVNQGAANSTGSGTSKTGDSTNSPSDAQTHNAQGSSAIASQNATETQRVVEIASSHSNAQGDVNQTVSSPTTTAPRMTSTPGETSHFGAMRPAAPQIDAESVPSMPTSAISDARLMQTMNESEMRIGLSSNAFGDISIRTSITGHQLVAQISLDHNELSQAISENLSAVQTKIGDEHGLHALIEINNHASSNSADAGGSSDRERGSPRAPTPTLNVVALGEAGSSLSQETVLSPANETRLDIRA